MHGAQAQWHPADRAAGASHLPGLDFDALRPWGCFISLVDGHTLVLGGRKATADGSHWMHRICPPDKCAQEHPEYCAMVDGRRFLPPAGMHG